MELAAGANTTTNTCTYTNGEYVPEINCQNLQTIIFIKFHDIIWSVIDVLLIPPYNSCIPSTCHLQMVFNSWHHISIFMPVPKLCPHV